MKGHIYKHRSADL